MTTYLTAVTLDSIRSFDRLSFEIPPPPKSESRRKAPHTIIIGKNGTCKTSILRSIAIGLCPAWDANALIAEPIGRLVREGHQRATIILGLGKGKKRFTIRTKLVNRGESDEDRVGRQYVPPRAHIPMVCGYGIARSVGEGPDIVRSVRIVDSAYTMFDYHSTLVATELILRRLRDYLSEPGYREAWKGISRILGLGEAVKVELPKGGGVAFTGPDIGGNIPIDGLADGLRVTLRWLLDLYGWAMRANAITTDGTIRGIVLIDEIEQHLHPSLQNAVLPRLGELMPELQVIATTHSPLIALNAHPQELVVLKRDGRTVVKHEAPSDLSGFSFEDALVDTDLFDASAYPLFLMQKIRRYQQIGAKRPSRRTTDERKELMSLARDLSQMAYNVEETAGSYLSELDHLKQKHNLE